MNILVTGADRGLGRALSLAYHARGDHVIAACLVDSPELRERGLQVEPQVDVTSNQSVHALADRLRTAGATLDILINNAGVADVDALGSFDFDAFRRQFEVNALGPLRVTEALLDRLRPGAKVAIVTSRMGSLGDNASGGRYGYRISKCAANMAGINLYHDLRKRGVAVILLHPGLVATDMSAPEDLDISVDPAVAAEGLRARIAALGPDTPPEFRHANGTLLPW
jgi:NAD(P)-dependent dehydrogenase (short-subunit alcohol dehydrogenase family)